MLVQVHEYRDEVGTLCREWGSNPFEFYGDEVEELFEELENHTIRQLKQLAKLRCIPKYSRLTKAELIDLLEPDDDFMEVAETLSQVDAERTLESLSLLAS